MKKIQMLNKIAKVGTDLLDPAVYNLGTEIEDPDGILVRSAVMHEMTFGEAFTLILYIASVIWFLVNYSQMSLINILLALMFVGLPVLIIYGLFIAPRKNK